MKTIVSVLAALLAYSDNKFYLGSWLEDVEYVEADC
jgi:hypothetical protein